MKKVLFAMVMVLTCSVFITSCRNSKGGLAEIVKKANKDCPVNMGIAGEINSIKYNEDANEVTMTMTLGDAMPLKIDVMNKMKSAMKKNMLSSIAATDDSKKMCKNIADAGATFVIVIKNKSGESMKLTLDEQEIKDVADGNIKAISPKEHIDYSVELSNAQCPIQVDQVTLLTSVKLVDNNIVYEYTIDEEQLPIENMEANQSQMRATLLNNLKSNDPSLSVLMRHCKKNNTGVTYKYTGNITGQTFMFQFSPSEI